MRSIIKKRVGLEYNLTLGSTKLPNLFPPQSEELQPISKGD